MAQRSLQMVRKTRAAASRASAARARLLPTSLGIHPLIADKVDVAAEARRSAMLMDLKSFKPNNYLNRCRSGGDLVKRGARTMLRQQEAKGAR